MQENKKRSYTVPVLLIIIMVLLTLIIIFYSKLLLTQQTHTTDQGKRLSEQYVYALIFAEKLHDGADKLLTAKTEVERLGAVRMLGQADIASGETSGLLVEARHLRSGQSKEEAAKPIVQAINAIIGEGSIIATVDKRDGPLTEQEIAALTVIRDGTAQMKEALNRFRPPSGEAGYRQMVTVGEWIQPALEAGKSLENMANKL
ncbi:hypothetical protein [Cohnella silvisoli]|uniref:Uncharacterized protein n=1 Tax=Cohnella silvisoli TaxID=2873699 RepID=A0ABV1KUW5_9BACL|nr:hypothetical protein [Cohnella silvisoli]MCD9022999.1 hypothetical protein [Cohnella silvisoli]